MNSSHVYSRAAVSWRLAFVHAGKTLHFLTRALLMSLASFGSALSWLCCWLDHFGSSKVPTAWLIRPASPSATAPESPSHVVLMERPARTPRTIDSLIRSRERE